MPDENQPPPAPAPKRRPYGPPEIPAILRDDDPPPASTNRRSARDDRKNSPEWRAMGIGVEFAAMVAGGALLGYAFDAWRNTFPTGTTVGGVLGLLSGGLTAVRLAMRLNRDMDAYERERKAGKPSEQPRS